MNLRACFRLRRGSLQLDVDLQAEAGRTLALVGPNGAGKSTVLQTLAGLLRVEQGCVQFGDEVFDGGPAGPWLAPERRGIGYVFQDSLLFPHLRAIDNVAFGLRARGIDRQKARAVAGQWLQRVGLADFADAWPRTLSGGQAQRVALARAMAASPRLLLLDEPLAAVDASARLELRRELRAHLEGFPGVRLLVAHDAIDAFALADRIAVLEAGRLVQIGSVAEICGQPRSRYVADLVGLNLFRGTACAGVLELVGGGRLVVPGSAEGAVIATVHPRAIALYRARPDGSPRNVWPAPIQSIEGAGDRIRVQLGGAVPLVAEVTPAAIGALGLGVGGEVWVALKATEIVVYEA